MSAVLKSLSSSETEAEEWRLRCDMAAVFRVSARLGWNEQIGNHNSLMLPGKEPTFLINPRGWRFEELTASSLIVCDLDGKVLRGTGELRKVAFHIHARIHMRNPAAACVVHVHPQYLTALSMLEKPELSLSHHNNLMLNDRVVIDLEGDEPVDNNSEGDRIADLMGNKTIMIMASHGVTVPPSTKPSTNATAPNAPRCIRSPRCPPAKSCGNCRTACAAAITAPGATRSMPACISMRGGGFWIKKAMITRRDGVA